MGILNDNYIDKINSSAEDAIITEIFGDGLRCGIDVNDDGVIKYMEVQRATLTMDRHLFAIDLEHVWSKDKLNSLPREFEMYVAAHGAHISKFIKVIVTNSGITGKIIRLDKYSANYNGSYMEYVDTYFIKLAPIND